MDMYWKGQNGKIDRERDTTMCRHGEKGMCDYCMPLEVSSVVHLHSQGVEAFHSVSALGTRLSCRSPHHIGDRS